MLPINKLIAHRGASAYAPENTMAAFNKALALGNRYIEFDVMCSVDGVPFVFHDDNLKRTTNGIGDLGQVDAAYLKSLDAGSWFSKRFAGESIPQFSEILQWMDTFDVQANIEIKPYPGTAEPTAVSVLSHINKHWPGGKPLPLVSSFDYEALSLCRSIAPEMPLGLLLDTWEVNWAEKAQQLQCYSVHCNHKILSASRVQEIKAYGYFVSSYTVNRKRLAHKLFSFGVDAVFSDYPDLLA